MLVGSGWVPLGCQGPIRPSGFVAFSSMTAFAQPVTDTAARQRIAAQWPSEQETARADFVINTNGSLAETNTQVEEIYRLLVARC